VCPCAPHSITSTTSCCSRRKGFYPHIFWPQKIFSDTLTQFQQKLVPKQHKKSSHISTWVEDTQSNILTWAAETYWFRTMPYFETFPCKPSIENWAAKNCHKPFKSWQVSKNVSASPNDPPCLVWKKNQGISATVVPRFPTSNLTQTQDLPSDSFEVFSCNVWKSAPTQTVGSCGPLKRQSLTRPSDHFQGDIHFCLSYSCCHVSLFCVSVCSPELLCTIQWGHKKVAFDWWTKWLLCIRKTSFGLFQGRWGYRTPKLTID